MNVKEPFVITISREAGSGGRTVGQVLAGKLNVRYCDKLLLESLEKQFGLSASEIEVLKGKKKNWLADFISRISPMPSAQAFNLDPRYTEEFRADVTTDDVFKAEVEILQEFARMGSCVIAGRSGFFALKDHPNKLSVFPALPGGPYHEETESVGRTGPGRHQGTGRGPGELYPAICRCQPV